MGRAELCSLIGAMLEPSPFGYCSVASTGAPSSRAALTKMRVARNSASMRSGGIVGTSFSCTSTMTTAVVCPAER